MLKIFALSLGLTLILELALALVWGLRGRDLALCALVNVLTNPVVVLLHTLFPAGEVVLCLEAGAVLVEGAYYARYGARVPRPWLFSLCANLWSYSMGLLIGPLL